MNDWEVCVRLDSDFLLSLGCVEREELYVKSFSMTRSCRPLLQDKLLEHLILENVIHFHA